MKFPEAKLEAAIIQLLEQQGIPYVPGEQIRRELEEVLIEADLRAFLSQQYQQEGIRESEIDQIIHELRGYPALDLYESNKAISARIANGFTFRREQHQDKDLHIQLIDYSEADQNLYKIVNQLEIEGKENKRIPDGILYVNGLPLVVFEFKSASREEVDLHEAYVQLKERYKRDIPDLFKYNAFCVISDGANTRAGSFFANYEHYYAWRRVEGQAKEVDGIEALYTLLEGMFQRDRLREIIHHFLFVPDKSHQEMKVLCRYPQFYAARALYQNILAHQKPEGDGKGGTYFGATGSGKSFTMLFLTRLLMKSPAFRSPTIVLITDRTDLDDQLGKQFTNAKQYIGDNVVQSVTSRSDLRAKLKGRNSGGVFLTTIHKFTEDTELLTERTNVICISDEAHRSQVNLEQKVRVTEKGVRKTYGFAKYLHDSLPNATYVGFTGTPIDATLAVFGEVVEAYTMRESVMDKITVPIVYEGRAAKVLLNQQELDKIEAYYEACAEEGSSDYQIEQSKKAMASMKAIIGHPDRVKKVAEDFVTHYEKRISEGSTLEGKAMFVCYSREVAYSIYQEILRLRPEWGEIQEVEDDSLTAEERRKITPMARVNMVMTRGKDDKKALYDLLGNDEHRKQLDRQFKIAKSPFKIAIVVDMWLTGFDVPFLDTMYIDKPIQRHTLIQTISRVNRKMKGKEKGLVVDYFGFRKQMNLALAHYNEGDRDNFEDVKKSVVVVKDHLDLLRRMFHKFDASPYFSGEPLQQLHCLQMAVEFVQASQEQEKRFMGLVKRLKAAYDICVGTDAITQEDKDWIHFFIAIRSIIAKLTKGEAPDTAQMNAKVQQMIEAAIQSEGVEELYKMGEEDVSEVNLFDPDYLDRLDKLKLPNTKIKLLQKLLAKAIEDFQRINRLKGIEFSKKMQALVERYNDREPNELWREDAMEEFAEEIMELIRSVMHEHDSHHEMDISIEEKAFYDILKTLTIKYNFEYPEEKLLILATAVKEEVDDKAKYTDWSEREDIKAELRVSLILLLDEYGYPPIAQGEVYQEVLAQAEGFRRGR